MKHATVGTILGFALTVGGCASDLIDEGHDKTSAERRELVIGELAAFNAELTPEVRAEKLSEKMALSAFAFYRGTAHLYYRDLADGFAPQSEFDSDETRTWIQGDMHVYNFGTFDDAEGLVYDLNDFDEGMVASYLNDVWRMAASLVLVGRENGFDDDKIEVALDAMSEAYLDELRELAEGGEGTIVRPDADGVERSLASFLDDVEHESRRRMIKDWTNKSEADETRRVFDPARFNPTDGKLAAVDEAERARVTAAIADYASTLAADVRSQAAQFEVLDVARRIRMGTGSLGTLRYYVLIAGDPNEEYGERILDLKVQGTPAMYPYLPEDLQMLYADAFGDEHGCRVAAAQRALSAADHPYLGCVTIGEDSFSVRERSPYKDSFETAGLDRPGHFRGMAAQWGEILAGSHARADSSDLIGHEFEKAVTRLTEGKHREFRDEVRAFGMSYAAQVLEDFGYFTEALASGEL